jgi:hypothetical protein
MKKVILTAAVAFTLFACDNAANTEARTKDSLDSVANAKKDMVDSSAETRKDRIDSTTEIQKDAVDKADSANRAKDTATH